MVGEMVACVGGVKDGDCGWKWRVGVVRNASPVPLSFSPLGPSVPLMFYLVPQSHPKVLVGGEGVQHYTSMGYRDSMGGKITSGLKRWWGGRRNGCVREGVGVLVFMEYEGAMGKGKSKE